MRTLMLCCLALTAFSFNSILNRAAVNWGEIGPAAFMSVRIISGAITLAVLFLWQGGSLLKRPDPRGVFSLLVYMATFSYAYLTLDAATGALIFAGGVQITMFAGAVLSGQQPASRSWIGSALGLAGIAILFWPGASAPSVMSGLLMLLAAIGSGLYSLSGRATTKPPLENTALNFIYMTPLGILIWVFAPVEASATPVGYLLAVIAGALASGAGFAIWFAVLPRISISLAAVVQLCVPVFATAGGVLLLSEPLTGHFFIAAAITLSGVGIATINWGEFLASLRKWGAVAGERVTKKSA